MKTLYSNFDHTFDQEVKKQFLEGPVGDQYVHAAWNFCGYIEKTEDGKFKEEIWRYGRISDSLYNENLEDLIKEVNEQYGND